MKWKHSFKHVDISEALKQFTEERFDKLEKYLLKESTANIYYTMEKHLCCVEMTVKNGNGHFKAHASGDTFYVAVDQLAQKLSKQFSKQKEKMQAHKKFDHSKQAKFEQMNNMMEFTPASYFGKKSA